ncbi:MAG TPA: DUF4276 family protein [Chloroflexota bacterium]|nr:DUF4276 family protein [Chloroflexota bacterium]
MELGCIIEGDGERDALPILLRRVIQEIDPALYVRVLRPIRRPRGQLNSQQQITEAVDLALRTLTPPCAVLILIDADDNCPAELGPRILGWARSGGSDLPIAVVLANREYEAWFLAAAESLRGLRGVQHDIVAPPDPETIAGAKEWLTERMSRRQSYKPTSHQASFSAVFDLELARRRAPSFDKLCRDVRRLMDAMRAGEG